MTTPPTPPTPPTLPPVPSPPPSAGRSRSRSWSGLPWLIVAALVGVGLGVAGMVALSPSGTDAPGTPPAAVGAQEAPPATTSDPANEQPPPGADAASSGGVVDQRTAEQAALAHLGEGRVTWVTPEDDRGAAWEIEVTLPNGREVDVLVDATGQVVDTKSGLGRLLP